jgi:hypothetical protein
LVYGLELEGWNAGKRGWERDRERERERVSE